MTEESILHIISHPEDFIANKESMILYKKAVEDIANHLTGKHENFATIKETYNTMRDFENEVWKDIPGWENFYQCSNLGRVRSCDRVIKNEFRNYVKKGRILKPWHTKTKKYMLVNLTKDSKNHYFLVHRLVAQTFLTNPLNLPEVNHKDEDPTNNRLDNLEYCTRKYNNNYGTKVQRGLETFRRNREKKNAITTATISE